MDDKLNHKTRYSAEKKRAVYDEFVAADLPRGYVECWVENKAAEIGCSVGAVRNWISHHKEMDNAASFGGFGTPAQMIAAIQGATVAQACRTLVRNLRAHNVKIVTDRDGIITDRAYTPNHEAQNSAAEKILKIHGAFAPDKHIVDVRPANDPSIMSDEQLEAELERLKTLKDSRGSDPAGDAHTPVPEGQLLLADDGNEDVRRPGQD